MFLAQAVRVFEYLCRIFYIADKKIYLFFKPFISSLPHSSSQASVMSLRAWFTWFKRMDHTPVERRAAVTSRSSTSNDPLLAAFRKNLLDQCAVPGIEVTYKLD